MAESDEQKKKAKEEADKASKEVETVLIEKADLEAKQKKFEDDINDSQR